MKAELSNGNLVITIPVEDPPVPSASGKTIVIASSRGNKKAGLQYDGKEVVIGVNAYIPLK